MLRPHLTPVLLRLYRAGLLVAVAWLIHQQHAWLSAQKDASLPVEKIRDFFPEAATLGPRDPASAVQKVLDGDGNTLGMVTQTAPLSDRIVGYSGSTNTLIALDAQGKVKGLRVLHSADTAEHLATVLRRRSFFDTFTRLKLGAVSSPPKIDAVSGATLTSTAIAQGVLARLGKPGPSLRFPNEISVDEVRIIKPDAQSLHPLAGKDGVYQVLDRSGKLIAQAARTAPLSDGIVGYKGPTDTLLVLSADGTRLEGFRLRKSYDTQAYVGYVTGDSYFTHLFDGMQVQKLGGLDFEEAKVEGVSGATETSWALAEGLKRRAASLTLTNHGKTFSGWLKSISLADWGLMGVIAMSVVMTFSKLRGIRWLRWLHQGLLIGYAGLYGGAMLSQGLLAGWAQHTVPWERAPALVLLAALALVLPLLTRRQFYCHHYCPHGALQQWLAHRLKWQIHIPHALGQWMEKLPVLLLVFVLAAVMFGWKVNLNALEPFDAWMIRIAGWSTLIIAVAGLMASLFVPMAYCRYGCPTGALLKYVRYTGQGDGFGRRDAVALAMVILAAMIHWHFVSK